MRHEDLRLNNSRLRTLLKEVTQNMPSHLATPLYAERRHSSSGTCPGQTNNHERVLGLSAQTAILQKRHMQNAAAVLLESCRGRPRYKYTPRQVSSLCTCNESMCKHASSAPRMQRSWVHWNTTCSPPLLRVLTGWTTAAPASSQNFMISDYESNLNASLCGTVEEPPPLDSMEDSHEMVAGRASRIAKLMQ